MHFETFVLFQWNHDTRVPCTPGLTLLSCPARRQDSLCYVLVRHNLTNSKSGTPGYVFKKAKTQKQTNKNIPKLTAVPFSLRQLLSLSVLAFGWRTMMAWHHPRSFVHSPSHGRHQGSGAETVPNNQSLFFVLFCLAFIFCLRIEETWRLWQKFLDDYSRFEDWLKISERTAAFPSSSGVLYTVAKEELKKFEVTYHSKYLILILLWSHPVSGSCLETHTVHLRGICSDRWVVTCGDLYYRPTGRRRKGEERFLC